MPRASTLRHARRTLPPNRFGSADGGQHQLGEGLRRSPILRSLAASTLELLLRSGSARTFGVGAHVQVQHAGVDRLLIVASGAVKAHEASRPGLDRLTAIIGPGGALNTATVIRSGASPQAATALRPTDVVSVPGDVVRDLLTKAPDLAVALVRALADELLVQRQDELLLGELDAPGRVALRLAQLGADWGTETSDGLLIDLSLSQEELGSWARVSRESAAKALHTFREDGVVSTGRRRFVVHALDKLEELAGITTIDLTTLAHQIV